MALYQILRMYSSFVLIYQRPYQNLAREWGKTYTRTESIVVAII